MCFITLRTNKFKIATEEKVVYKFLKRKGADDSILQSPSEGFTYMPDIFHEIVGKKSESERK